MHLTKFNNRFLYDAMSTMRCYEEGSGEAKVVRFELQ